MPSQSPVVQLLDFVDVIVSQKGGAKEHMNVLASYFVFAMVATIVWRCFSDRDFSTVLTLASGIQCLGFYLLLSKIRAQRSAAGISSKTLQLYVLVFVFRLMSTCVKNGYLPVDKSGDWVYQAADFCSLLLVLQLLFTIHKPMASTYQANLDTMPIYRCIPPAVAIAVLFHGNLNHSPFFDICWTISMNLDTIAMLPQLWLLVAMGGEVEALTSHYVASIAIARCLAFSFWWHGFSELAPKKGGFNTAGYLIMGAHGTQVLLSADFLYHYFTWNTNGQTRGGLVLPGATEL